ncbi:odorant receptor 98a [Drosophila obscura]|uniref:odorant receptor 98a n=1 Tax=Drosophila obscura TaxID=7282 RepID=UPI000BA16BB6|nr:odorant receptor 98a [Drosophila obscura]
MLKLLEEPDPSNLMTSQDSFKLIKHSMISMGWIPPEGGWTPVRKVIAIIIVAWSTVYVPIGIYITFYVGFKNLSVTEVLSALQVAINATGFAFKLLFLRLNLSSYYKIKDLLVLMDARCIDVQERIEVHRWVARCNIAYLIYQAIFTTYTASTYIIAAFSRMAPWNIYYPFIDWHDGSMSLWIVSVLELIPMYLIVYKTAMVDCFSLLFSLILRAHIKLLRQRVEKLCTDPSKSDDDNNKELENCIEDHKRILEYASIMRPMIEPVIFVQFLLVGLVLGISMINLTFFADSWARLSTLAYIFLQIAQTFPFCGTCDLIIEDCESLAVAIFHSNWRSASRRYVSTLFYFLQNVQVPISFTAGSIFPIGLSTNIKVAKLAFSVVTFVNQLGLGQ